jgi:hypothetical protein
MGVQTLDFQNLWIFLAFDLQYSNFIYRLLMEGGMLGIAFGFVYTRIEDGSSDSRLKKIVNTCRKIDNQNCSWTSCRVACNLINIQIQPGNIFVKFIIAKAFVCMLLVVSTNG